MKSADIRQAFLDFFADKDHQVVASSPLIPANDPTLLFTNAGMVQFKDVFLGKDKRNYQRATSSQRVVRAGGKHNDLENVGYTARHHTFFEMLGNFSFGDYFKREAIQYAWEFLTVTLKLPKDKLWVTVFHEDQEAEDIWIKEMGIDPERFSRLGEKDNFWSMGDTGPCGPCTEIFFDHGPDVAGGPPGTPEEDGDRYIEIWNLVFMQFDRQPDGEMKPLPRPSVDTGMGLERIAAVMQGVHNNYEIDLFANLIKGIAGVIGCKDLSENSLRVVADHIRSCAFLVVDGVMPSNEGRGYVLRRIIRRAVRHGNKLGAKAGFFHQCVKFLAAEMGDAYPELKDKQAQVEKILRLEEEQFAKTLDQGLKILEQFIADMGDSKTISGELLFKLYDTYGFPVDLTGDIARERGLSIDEAGFEACMQEQRTRSQEHSGFDSNYYAGLNLNQQTEFSGYEKTKDDSKIVALFVDGESVESADSGSEVIVVLDKTPFYGESGGQVGDAGFLLEEDNQVEIRDTTKEEKTFLHHGKVQTGSISVGQTVTCYVDVERRDQIRLNHSATHLMHAALREILGEHVTQKGSLVDQHHLRFDFSHVEAVKADELEAIEQIVNEQIRANTEVSTELMAIDDAKEKGAMALFGEKYDDEVRVLSMGRENYSVELCGGTHAKRTGDIGAFKITSESGIAAGVRRIEGVTGRGAFDYIQDTENTLGELSGLVKANRSNVVEKIKASLQRTKELEKELERLKSKLAASAGDDLAGSAKEIKGVKVLAAQLEGVSGKDLRETLDQLKNKLGSCVVVLGVASGDKVSLIAGVSEGLVKKVKAGELVNFVAQQVGGKGGGRPDMAQAGGKDASQLPTAIDSVAAWVEEKL